MSPASAARAARDLSFVGREAESYIDIPTASRAIERLGQVVVAAIVKTVRSKREQRACWDLISDGFARVDLDRDPF